MVDAGSAVHVPSALAPFAFVHASHEPLHAASQQTPSRHEPLAHCRSRAHVAPAGCVATHVVPAQ
jgi:hypothetical protein